MSNIVKLVANFETTTATKITSGATSFTLTSATDKDGDTLPAGDYGFTISEGESNEQHVVGTVSGTSVTALKTVDRATGAETSGSAKVHRVGSSVKVTAFPALTQVANILNGDTDLDATVVLKYATDPTISDDKELTVKKYVDDQDETLLDLAGTRAMTGAIDMGSQKITNLATPTASTDGATKAYVDSVGSSGASDASETVKGIVEEATQAEMDAGTDTGGTSAKLFVPPSKIQQYVSDYVSENAVCGFQEYVVNNVNFGSDDALCVAAEQDGSVVYVGGSEDNASTGNLRRYERDSATGVLNCTDVVNSGRPTTPIQMALEPLGDYLYQLFEDNGTVRIYRWDKADLTNQTTMTVSSITINVSYYSMFTDGTDLWIYNNAGQYEQCTVSGTTITGGGTTITPASITGGPVASHSDGTHIWTITDTVAANNLYKHLLSDGSLVSSKNYWTDTSFLTDFAAIGYIPQTASVYDFVYAYTGVGIVSGVPDDVAKIVFKAFTKL